MEDSLWIALTIAAAFLQNIRSLLQKQLTGRLSVNGASYVRFCYALPFVWLYLTALLATRSLPLPGAEFWGFCFVGAVGQMVATSALVASFAQRNFAVGTAFSKTEVLQAALFGLVVLGDPVSESLVAGIAISLVGVWLLLVGSSGTPGFLRGTLNAPGMSAALALGLISGGAFAVAFVAYRGAALSLPTGDYLVRAGLTLVAAVTLQTVLMAAYLRLREPGQLRRVIHAWRPGLAVGISGALASVGWFTAATLASAALVRGLGQIELIFALLTSAWFFRERLKPQEVLGAVLVVAGVWVLL